MNSNTSSPPQIVMEFPDEQHTPEPQDEEIYTPTSVDILQAKTTPFGKIMIPSGRKTKAPETAQLTPEHPIPLELYQMALSYMHWTFTEFNAEGMIFGFQHNETGEWIFQPPEQETYGMTVSADNSDAEAQMAQNNYTLRFTMHHHCRAAAGQSGTDKTSEHSQPTALHVTIGDMERENYSFHARLILQGPVTEQKNITDEEMHRFLLLPTSIHLPKAAKTALVKYRTIVDFPEEWKAKIKKGSTVIHAQGQPPRPNGYIQPTQQTTGDIMDSYYGYNPRMYVNSHNPTTSPTSPTSPTSHLNAEAVYGNETWIMDPPLNIHEPTPRLWIIKIHELLAEAPTQAVKIILTALQMTKRRDSDNAIICAVAQMLTFDEITKYFPEIHVYEDVKPAWLFYSQHTRAFTEGRMRFTTEERWIDINTYKLTKSETAAVRKLTAANPNIRARPNTRAEYDPIDDEHIEITEILTQIAKNIKQSNANKTSKA